LWRICNKRAAADVTDFDSTGTRIRGEPATETGPFHFGAANVPIEYSEKWPVTNQCLAAVSGLGIMIVGMLMIARIITLEQVMNVVGRFLLLVVSALLALCILRSLLIAVVIPWLSFMKTLLVWLAIITIVIIVVMVVARIIVSRFET